MPVRATISRARHGQMVADDRASVDYIVLKNGTFLQRCKRPTLRSASPSICKGCEIRIHIFKKKTFVGRSILSSRHSQSPRTILSGRATVGVAHRVLDVLVAEIPRAR